ncbi:MAG: SRPBCC family protein [Defluviicoccus sp.]|nr:MAG: SRPBCC family protein [Defluviicoccus sp.]
MTKVTVSTKLLAPAEEVWRLVGGWNALPDWHPAVETSVIEDGGHRRRVRLADGCQIIEQLEKFDGEAKTYTYSIVSGSLPLTDYRSTITVSRQGEKSTIEWSTSFRPMGVPENELSRMLEEFYQSGFDNLRKMLGT